MDEQEVKKTVISLDAGIAKPISISSDDSIKIAREQNIENINKEEKEQQGLLDQTNDVIKPTLVDENNEVDLNRMYQVNDLIQQQPGIHLKYKYRAYMIMIFIILIIIAIFVFVELPMLRGM